MGYYATMLTYRGTSVIRTPLGPHKSVQFMVVFFYLGGFNCTQANVRDFKWDRATV